LHFSEIPIIGLGYSINHTGGKGIGDKLANNLVETVIKFVKLGIVDPVIFELLPLFETGIGADRISDMIIHILLPDIVLFSIRVARSLNLPISSAPTLINNQYFNDLPCYSNHGILLVPNDILTEIPLERSWTDIDTIALHNQNLKQHLNKMLGNSWKNLITLKDFSNKKKVLKQAIFEYPEILDEILYRYRNKSVYPYNFNADSKEKFKWHDRARDYAARFPLYLPQKDNIVSGQEIATVIIAHFEKLIDSGLACDFHKKIGDPKKEQIGQLIFLELLECYTRNTDLYARYNCKNDTVSIYTRKLPYDKNLLVNIILKFSSTQRVHDFYVELLKKAQNSLIFDDTAFVLILTNRGRRTWNDLISLNYYYNNSDKLKFFFIDGTWR
jgi:hypothetical protein